VIALVLWLHLSGGAGVQGDVKVEEGRLLVHSSKQSCNVPLSDADRDKLTGALRNIRPDDWKKQYISPGCADCLRYSLQVGETTTIWDEVSAPKVPVDARAVAAVLQDLMSCQ
jgi:hypothetical protein